LLLAQEVSDHLFGKNGKKVQAPLQGAGPSQLVAFSPEKSLKSASPTIERYSGSMPTVNTARRTSGHQKSNHLNE